MTRYLDNDRACDAPDLNDLAELYGAPHPAGGRGHDREDYYSDVGGPGYFDEPDFDD